MSRIWVSCTRTHLFESLKVTDSKFSSLDPSYLTPLHGHVKTLHFTWPADATKLPAILDCFERFKPHTLVIHSCEPHNLDEQTIRRYFAKFPCTSITALKMLDICLTHRAFLILLSVYPNADDLTISVALWWKEKPSPGQLGNDSETIPRISPPHLRGSFKSFKPPSRVY